jgi:hypothetical protein
VKPGDWPPDDFTWADLIGNGPLLREMIVFKQQLEAAEFLVACQKRHWLASARGKNLVMDLRVPLPAAPVLTVTENDPELAVTWTQEETGFSGVYLERSIDGGTTFTPLANLEGDATSYDDAAVEVDVEYCYRVRNRRCGIHSMWSNIDCGMLEVSGCVYSPPGDMGSSTPFKQSFVGADFSDANWNANMQAATTSIRMSENGRKIVVTGDFGVGNTARVLTREDDDSFTVEVLHSNTGLISFGGVYSISRNGIIAGSVSNQSAVWLSGATSAPTIDATVNRWDAISPDGTKLYGVNDSSQAIERTVGGADVVIATNCFRIGGGVNHCGDVLVVNSNGDDPLLVYKYIAGTWTHVATLADTTGDTEASSVCNGISGDGTKAFGSNDASTVPYLWDLTGTGTISATAMGVPADDIGARCLVNSISSDGTIAVGEYEPGSAVGAALYWLASEGFATAHNLDLYFTSAGITGLGNSLGEYFSLDTVRCSADGTQFAFRCQKQAGGSNRNLLFVAVPAPA